MNNGNFPSGSSDKTIKIWNTESGDCVKTLHSENILRLQALESGELVSCSAQKNTKVWNLNKESRFIKTQVENIDKVIKIRVNERINSLAGFTYDGTI